MGMKYLWDTNTVIYYLQKQFPPSAEKFIDDTLEVTLTTSLLEFYICSTSAFTRLLLFCFKF